MLDECVLKGHDMMCIVQLDECILRRTPDFRWTGAASTCSTLSNTRGCYWLVSSVSSRNSNANNVDRNDQPQRLRQEHQKYVLFVWYRLRKSTLRTTVAMHLFCFVSFCGLLRSDTFPPSLLLYTRVYYIILLLQYCTVYWYCNITTSMLCLLYHIAPYFHVWVACSHTS